MPFDWLHAQVPAEFKSSEHDKATAMYLEEARERAALLRRLGWGKSAVLSRVRRNFEWGFELHTHPAFMNQLPEVVEQVFRHPVP